MEMPSDFQGVADLSGVCASYSEQKCDIRMNWCYNLGKLRWSGRNIYVGGLMGLEDAETASGEYIHINHSYSICQYEGSLENNVVGSIVGLAKSTVAPTTVSNTFGAVINQNVSAFGQFVGAYTNNVKGYAYSELYHDVNIPNYFLPTAKFANAYKFGDYYDYIAPMNTDTFTTNTTAIIRQHDVIKANSYKRYIRTIQQ